MSAPEVSVVMAVYNGAEHLRRALDSVLEQRDVDLEFVVVDDGSQDETLAILRERAAVDPRLRVLTQSNTGLTRALVRGCAESRGPFIARMDVDDVSLEGRFAKQAQALRSDPSLAMVSCRTGYVGPLDEQLYDVEGSEDAELASRDLLERSRGPAHGSVMFRRTAYLACGGYRPEFYFAQDSDLWLRMGEVGRFRWLPEKLYLFRVSEASLSSRWWVPQARLGALSRECLGARREGRSEEPFLEEARGLRPGLVSPGRSGRDGAGGTWFLARCLLKNRDRRGLRYALRYLRSRPWEPKAWVSLLSGVVLAGWNPARR